MISPSAHRLVFVGGLHRSGTTPLVRWLGAHPQVSGFRDTGVPEDEGQHLQSVFPPAIAHGGPGRFAFDRAAHLTDASPLVSGENRARLLEEWGAHWDATRPVLIEKSPPNLVRMRFLEAMFPGCRFIVVVRHPIAVSYATLKWQDASIPSLLGHWAAAHRTFLEDAHRVGRLALVRYEDLVRDTAAELRRLLAFLELPPADLSPDVQSDLNEPYLRRWEDERRPRLLLAAARHERAARAFGYSLLHPRSLSDPRDPLLRSRIDSGGSG